MITIESFCGKTLYAELEVFQSNYTLRLAPHSDLEVGLLETSVLAVCPDVW